MTDASVRATLCRLAKLAGVQTAEIFAQFVTDLTSAQHALHQATLTRDIAGFRAQSHVIISLAGTLGAQRLHRDAVAANRRAEAAHDVTDLTASARALDAGLSHLIDLVQNEASKLPKAS